MAVKIRLQRHGKKNFAFFHIVVADSRSPRDGRFIEQLGSYNPNTNPATIVLDSDKALKWLNVGAQPTLTARRILSYEGVLLRKHLQEGVAKGALTQAQADEKFAAWKAGQDQKIADKKAGLKNEAIAKAKEAKAAEAKLRKPPARPPKRLPPRPPRPSRPLLNNAADRAGTEIQRPGWRAPRELFRHLARGYRP